MFRISDHQKMHLSLDATFYDFLWICCTACCTTCRSTNSQRIEEVLQWASVGMW